MTDTTNSSQVVHPTSNGTNGERICCIIPVYNGETYLPEALMSVAAQTHPIDEIIIVDDGSTDGTRTVIEAHIAAGTMPIHYLWQERAGPATARNRGIGASTSEIITFLDADDLWQPDKIARQLARFAARPELGISVTHVQNFWMEDVREEQERLRSHMRAQPVAGYVLQTMMTRRSVFAQVGLLNPDLQFSDGTEWFMRAQAKQVVEELLSEVLVRRRLHAHNHTRIGANESRMEYLRLLKTRVQRPVLPTAEKE